MDDDNWVWGLLIIGGAILSFLIPEWIARAIGYEAEHAQLIVWWKTQEPLVKWSAFAGYVLAGFAVLAAAVAGGIAVIAAVVCGFVQAGKAAFHAVRRLVVGCLSALGMGISVLLWVVLWPVRTVFGWIWEVIEDRFPELRLYRTYRTQFRGRFGSYQEFRKYWDEFTDDEDAGEAGEEDDGPEAGTRRDEAGSGVDDFADALRILAPLPDGFTRADLDKRFKELMMRVHPDQRGSDYFAQQVNWAKATIMDRKGWM